MKTPTDRLSEFDEKFTINGGLGTPNWKDDDDDNIPNIKRHLVQTILSVLQEQVTVVESQLTDIKKKEGSNIESWGIPGKVAYYYVSNYKHSLEAVIAEWEKMV